MKSEYRRIKSAFRPDEHFLESDVCDVIRVVFHDDPAAGPSNLDGRRVVVSFTSHAIYVRPFKWGGFELIRIPYERVLDVAATPGFIEVVTTKSSWLLVDVANMMKGNKFQLVSDGIRRIENHRQVVTVPGGTVAAIHRPFDERDAGRWMFECASEIDVTSEPVRSALRAALAAPIARFGDLDVR